MYKVLAKNVIWSLTIWLGIFQVLSADTEPPVSQSDKNWSITEPQLSELERQLFADASDGQLDEFSLLDAALIAGGVKDSAELGHYRELAATLTEELKRSGGSSGSPRRQVEAVFAFMHGKILRGHYDIKCTDLRQVLDEGSFNCVSATVLFNCLAGDLGLSCSALEMPEHVLSRVYLAEGPLDVETTCPKWFCLRHEALINNAARKGTVPFSYDKTQEISQRENGDSSEKEDKAKLRKISPIQLTAMIYYNRGIELLAEKRFSDAAGANAKAIRLDPLNGPAQGNLLATINNWAIDLANTGNYGEAAALLRQGLALDPLYEAFSLNFVHVHHQWSQELCKAGRYQEAVALLNRAAAEMPENPCFRRTVWGVYRSWAIALLKADKVDGAFDILQFVN